MQTIKSGHPLECNMERAKSIHHAEYAVLQQLLDGVDLHQLKKRMVPDGDNVAEDRFNKGAEKVCKLIENLSDRRRHKLPQDHPHYKAKVE
jgi:hypothetical protein